MSTKAKNTLESMGQAVWYNRWTLQKFEKFLSGDILEIGCGIGNFTEILSNYGNIWAIDINKNYVKQLGKELGKKVKVGFGDIEKGEYFFKSKTFDTIVCINVLEHIKDDGKALQNIHNLLKKEGKIIFLVPIYNFLYGEIDRSIHHFRRYNPEQFKKKLKQVGFAIEKSRKLNFLGAFGWFIAGRILKNKQAEGSKVQLFNILAPFCLSIEDFIEPAIGTSVLIIAKKV